MKNCHAHAESKLAMAGPPRQSTPRHPCGADGRIRDAETRGLQWMLCHSDCEACPSPDAWSKPDKSRLEMDDDAGGPQASAASAINLVPLSSSATATLLMANAGAEPLITILRI